MPDNIKFNVVERNGVDLEFQEETEFIPSNMPFDDENYTATDVEAAIIETAEKGGRSRFVIPFGYNAVVQDGRYLELFRGNGSDDMPYVATETTELISISGATPSSPTLTTFIIYKNDIQVATLEFTDSIANKMLSPIVSLVKDDKLSIKKDSGDNLFAVNVYFHFKVPF